jgi:hypothetical protein
MSFWPVYLGGRFFFRIADFFRHWYADGTRYLFHGFISFLASLDRVFAVRITWHYFTRPLYGDYSAVGRVLGVVFRSFRILIALAVYAALAGIFLLFYLLWLVAPFIPLFMIARNSYTP